MIKKEFENSTEKHVFEQLAADDLVRFQRETVELAAKIESQKELIIQIAQKELQFELNAIYTHPIVIQL